MMKMIFVILVTLLPGYITLAGNPLCTEREKEMIDEINYARTNPAEYAQYIDEYIEEWEELEGMTSEGNKLKKILLAMKPVQPLEFSQKLYDLSKKHGSWMKQTGQFEHSHFNAIYGENLCAGTESVRMAVVDLLIDYGIPGYGHRMNILDPEYKFVAVYEIPGKAGYDEYVFIQQFAYNELAK